MKDVVLIGGHHEPARGETHALGVVPRQNVPEVPRRHGIAKALAVARGQRFSCGLEGFRHLGGARPRERGKNLLVGEKLKTKMCGDSRASGGQQSFRDKKGGNSSQLTLIWRGGGGVVDF